MDAPFTVEEKEGDLSVTLRAPWDDAYLRKLDAQRVSALSINHAHGFRGDDVDFVGHFPHLRRLQIQHLAVKDISAIQTLHELEVLTVGTYCKTRLDFGNFPRLVQCFLEWRPGADSVFDCISLRDLYVNRFTDVDLRRVGRLHNLTKLQVGNDRRLTSLAGVEGLEGTEMLGLYMLPNLASLDGVVHLAALRTLRIDTCRRIASLAPLAGLRELRELSVDNSGDIESLAPLRGLDRLERVFFVESTRIVDGDLSTLLHLPALQKTSFQNRRSYSITREEIAARLGLPDAFRRLEG